VRVIDLVVLTAYRSLRSLAGAPAISPFRVFERDRVVPDVGVQVYVLTIEAKRVLRQEAADLGFVVTGSVVRETRFRVWLAAGEAVGAW
jgi:hypothetical protein